MLKEQVDEEREGLPEDTVRMYAACIGSAVGHMQLWCPASILKFYVDPDCLRLTPVTS
jgi:hypothetical protein